MNREGSQVPQIAVVTGAGSGIGAAVAHALAGKGWTVVLAGRRQDVLVSVADRGRGLLGALDPVATDVTDEGALRMPRSFPQWRALPHSIDMVRGRSLPSLHDCVFPAWARCDRGN